MHSKGCQSSQERIAWVLDPGSLIESKSLGRWIRDCEGSGLRYPFQPSLPISKISSRSLGEQPSTRSCRSQGRFHKLVKCASRQNSAEHSRGGSLPCPRSPSRQLHFEGGVGPQVLSSSSACAMVGASSVHDPHDAYGSIGFFGSILE